MTYNKQPNKKVAKVPSLGGSVLDADDFIKSVREIRAIMMKNDKNDEEIFKNRFQIETSAS
ncbi:hypothetical protein KKC32_01660 [Patescibacteria group bacterium]|nr:hypothetical protein [Patescibacteria group bacterium]